MREITYLEAVREALWQEMERDERVFVIGEDVGVYGGAFGVTRGMVEHFGEERIIDTPISEYAIVGTAIGAALCGRRPVAEILFSDFAPATPYDAKGMLIASIRSNNPVLFFENKLLYTVVGPVPEQSYVVPLGVADIKRHGSDGHRRERRSSAAQGAPGR